jgi:hypothetical protein
MLGAVHLREFVVSDRSVTKTDAWQAVPASSIDLTSAMGRRNAELNRATSLSISGHQGTSVCAAMGNGRKMGLVEDGAADQ